VGKIRYACHNNKDKAVIRLNVEKHLYMTHKLLAPTYRVQVAGLGYPLNSITTKRDPQMGSIDHTTSQNYTKNHVDPIPCHNHAKTIPNPSILIERGSQTSCNRKLGYHDSCIICKG
jgi:hypothetical protein